MAETLGNFTDAFSPNCERARRSPMVSAKENKREPMIP
jgi:hypothetical protein